MTTSYNVRAELETPPAPATAEALLDALADYHPAAGRSPFGRLEVLISLPADTLRQAATTGTAVIEAAAGRAIASLEVLTTDDFDRRLGLTPIPELLSVTEAAAGLGVTRQAVLQRIEAGSLPATRIGNSWAIPASGIIQPDNATPPEKPRRR